jgi:hypothetical protein
MPNLPKCQNYPKLGFLANFGFFGNFWLFWPILAFLENFGFFNFLIFFEIFWIFGNCCSSFRRLHRSRVHGHKVDDGVRYILCTLRNISSRVRKTPYMMGPQMWTMWTMWTMFSFFQKKNCVIKNKLTELRGCWHRPRPGTLFVPGPTVVT